MAEITIHEHEIYSSMRHRFINVDGKLEYSTHGGKGYFGKIIFSDGESPEKPRKIIAHSAESIDALMRALAIANGFEPVNKPHFKYEPGGNFQVSVELQHKDQKYRGVAEFEKSTTPPEAAIRAYFNAVSQIIGKIDVKFQQKGN